MKFLTDSLRVRNKNAPLLRMAAIASDFVFGQKGAQRAADFGERSTELTPRSQSSRGHVSAPF